MNYAANMLRIIFTLLVIWVIVAVLGFVIKGLFWLAIIGIVLFVATGVIGWVRRSISSSRRGIDSGR